MIPQSDIGFGHVFLHVNWLVEIVVDKVVLRGLFTDVVAGRWHANQVHLMERESFRAYPGVLLVLLAVVEHFAA